MNIDELLQKTYTGVAVPRPHEGFAGRVTRRRAVSLSRSARRVMRVYWILAGIATIGLLLRAGQGWMALAGLVVLFEALRRFGWNVVAVVRRSIALLLLLAASVSRADDALDRAFVSYRAVALVSGEQVWADASPDAPRTFAVYSVAKPWTAAAAARLAELGKLDPHAPIQKLVPSFPEKREGAITAIQLATHTAGVRHYSGDEAAMQNCADLESTLRVFREDPLLFAPGTGRSYSTWGFVLLSAAIESAAKRPFEEAMAELVFARAGMVDTRLSEGLRCKWGGGGFVSSAGDLARFYHALMAGRLLSPDFATLVLNVQGGEVSVGGSGVAGRAQVFVDVEKRIVVAIAGVPRDAGADLGAIARRIARRLQ